MGIALPRSCNPLPTSRSPYPVDHDHAYGGDPARLRVTLTWTGGRCVVSLAGDLDADSSVALATEYDQLVRSGFDEVVLDVAMLRSIDGMGGLALAELWNRLRNDGVICRVRGLHPVFSESPVELIGYLRDAGKQKLDQVSTPRSTSRPDER